ncbi:MAG: ChbG/HpnK family deacetylase [Chitinophagales bacterium]
MNKRKVVLTVVFLLVVSLLVILINPVNLLLYKVKPSSFLEDGKNIAQILGYDKNAKLLVVNSDDSGGHPNFTDGILEVMEFGLVKSTSIIVNDRNDEELKRIAELAKLHPDWGIGIHLSLNNEYQENYPWAPVLSQDVAPSLYNEDGLAWEKVAQVEQYVDPVQAAMEYEAQIEKALQYGIKLTHIDSHMGTAYIDCAYEGASANGLRDAAIYVAEKFNLPITVNPFDKKSKESIEQLDALNIIRPDVFFGFYELEDINRHMGYEGSAIRKLAVKLVLKLVLGLDLPYTNYTDVAEDVPVRMKVYKQAIKKLVKPGLNHFFIHVAEPDANNDQSIPDGKHHAAGVDDIVRQGDLEVWTSEEMKQFLADQNIVLINYAPLKDIQDKQLNENH